MGRRTANDARPIQRGAQSGTTSPLLRTTCEKGDLERRRKQRQAVLHWAYDSHTL